MSSVDDHASNFFLKRPKPKVTLAAGSSFNNHESIRLIQSDVAVYKSKLELIFRSGRACVSPVLTLDRWRILMLQHFKVTDKHLSPADIDWIYEKKDTEWNFNCFVTALWDSAIRKYVDRGVVGKLKIVKRKLASATTSSAPQSTPSTSSAPSSLPADINMRGGAKKQNAFKKLLSLIFESPFSSVYFHEIPLTRWNETPNIESIFHVHDKILRRLFLTYAKRVNSALEDSYADKERNTNILPYVTYQKFVKFCTDYRFYPERIEALSLQRIFATFDDRKDSTTYNLDFPHFCDAFIRFAIMLFSNDSSSASEPHEQLQLLFDEIAPIYESMYDRALSDDLVDLSRIGPPTITSVDPTSVPSSGNMLISVFGKNFDQRLGGVVVRIAPPHLESTDPSPLQHTDVPCRFITSTEVQCRMPPITATPLKMKTHVELRKDNQLRDTYIVEVSNRAPFHIQASNSAKDFSSLVDEENPVIFEYVDCMDPFTIDPAVIQPLYKIFTQYCQLEEPKNSRLLSVYKWKILKHEMSKIRQLQLPHYPDIIHSMDRDTLVKKMRVVTVSEDVVPKWSDVQSTSQVHEENLEDAEDDEEDNVDCPEFYIFAQARPRKKLVVFLEFVRMLIYFALFTIEELHPGDFLLELAARWEQVIPKSKTILNIMPLDQVSQLEKEVALIRTQDQRCFDVYNGCVLVGNLLDTPGYVQRVGETVLTAMAHKLWTYKQYDIHTQSAVMKIMEFSSSFEHFLHRLLDEGFDIAAPTADINTRSPLGRSWIIFNSLTQERIGAVWDYPGTIARKSWVPRARQIDKAFTLTVYQDSEFLPLFVIFQKSDSIQRFRELLQRSGVYKIRTRLLPAFA